LRKTEEKQDSKTRKSSLVLKEEREEIKKGLGGMRSDEERVL
jgi:hypothetical protein